MKDERTNNDKSQKIQEDEEEKEQEKVLGKK